jgi:hypothetical protein
MAEAPILPDSPVPALLGLLLNQMSANVCDVKDSKWLSHWLALKCYGFFEQAVLKIMRQLAPISCNSVS